MNNEILHQGRETYRKEQLFIQEIMQDLIRFRTNTVDNFTESQLPEAIPASEKFMNSFEDCLNHAFSDLNAINGLLIEKEVSHE